MQTCHIPLRSRFLCQTCENVTKEHEATGYELQYMQSEVVQRKKRTLKLIPATHPVTLRDLLLLLIITGERYLGGDPKNSKPCTGKYQM